MEKCNPKEDRFTEGAQSSLTGVYIRVHTYIHTYRHVYIYVYICIYINYKYVYRYRYIRYRSIYKEDDARIDDWKKDRFNWSDGK